FTLAACDTNDPDDGDRLRARDDTAETAPGQPVTIDVLANDDGDDVRLVDFDATTPNGGTGTRTDSDTGPRDEQRRATPSNDFIGTDTFTYTITDDSGDTDEATVTVTVSASGGNRAPEARDNAAQTVEGQPVTIDVLANDSDPDGDSLFIQSFQTPTDQGGTVEETNDGRLRYTPADGFTGTDTFTYVAEDEGGLSSNTATVTVTVTPAANNPPTANDDATQVLAGQSVIVNVLDNDTDPDGDDLDLAAVGNPSGRSFTGVDIETGAGRYLAPDEPGTYTFQYTATDGEATDSATVTVTVK